MAIFTVAGYKFKVAQRAPTIKCPHCGGVLTREFLTESVGKVISRMRKTFGGPEKVLYTCGCGETFSAREIREHKCPLKPPRGEERPATKEERQRYFAERTK